MLRRQLQDNDDAADKIIVIALVSLLTVSVISAIAYMNLDSEETDSSPSNSMEWIDPVVEIEDENHSHCLLYTSPSPRDSFRSRMPSSA